MLLPFAVGLVGSQIHWSLAVASQAWGQVLGSLYYLPIVIAAISLGARPALIVALAAGASHVAASVFGRDDPWVQPIAQTILFVCVGLTAARLAEWLRSDAIGTATPKSSMPGMLERTFSDTQHESQIPALSRVAVGLVRQFRTPLTSIEGAGWVLEDSRLPDEKRQEFVGIVRKESHRLNRVLSDVLDFARPRRPRFHSTDLSPLIDDVFQLAGPREHGPFILFRKDIPTDFPPLRCDPEQIRQVLLNLVMNGIQASPGGGEIEISARVQESSAVIKVKDNGRGIAPQILDKIFDPFFTTHENNLGLGLAVALHIITEHGGTMAVESPSEKGVCILITLPLSPTASP